MIVCIHQPEHLPWLGLFHKIAISDIYIVLDNVQFKKNYFENRNKIYTVQGWQWITLPVKMQGYMDKKFFEMELVDGWRRKYLATLQQNYSKSPFFKDIVNVLKCIENFEGNSLSDLNLLIIKEVCTVLDINTIIKRAKDMSLKGNKTELLIDILTQLNATEYIVGKSGFDYMDLNLFNTNNIRLKAHSFNHPKYIPFNFTELSDYPSVLDVIANIGKEKVKEFIKRQYDN
jgi:hypothetical protein